MLMVTPTTFLRIATSIAFLGVLFSSSCYSSSTPESPPVPDTYTLKIPANFPKPVFIFDTNPITKEGFELGRNLFYDPRLSSDGTIACGTCHRQLFAFADHGHGVSHGVGDKLGDRNTPALQNMAFQPEFFWDGGVNHIEFTPLNAIQNPKEMNETLKNVLDKLNATPTYKKQFKAVFGTDSITSQRMLQALAQFMGMLVSSQSRYDSYVRGESGVQFTDEEKAGMTLFKQKCATCHATDLFTDHSFRNNGLNTEFQDKGRETITLLESDRGKFRVPSLRNVERTAPYMHDGRFYSLESVLNHYSSGIKDSPTLDPVLKKNQILGTPLSETEKKQLIAFLKTLTDPTFLVDSRFADPIGTGNPK